MTKKSEHPDCRRFREQIESLAADPTKSIGRSLAQHVETCEACRDLLDEITHAQYLLDRAKWRSMPAGTLAHCNRQAMKKLEVRIRESAKGKDLAVALPDLPQWQLATIRMTRGGIGVAAGLAVIMFNWAACGGMNVTQDQLQRLADTYHYHHIDKWKESKTDLI